MDIPSEASTEGNGDFRLQEFDHGVRVRGKATNTAPLKTVRNSHIIAEQTLSEAYLDDSPNE